MDSGLRWTAYIADMMKCGVIGFVGARVVRSVGEKEIGEIINGASWAIVGLDMVFIAYNAIMGFDSFYGKVTAPFLKMAEYLGWLF